MAVAMRVKAELDPRSAKQAADTAERTFGSAGHNAGQQFGKNFQDQIATALDERVVEKSAAKIIAQMARTGKTSAEAMNQAIANEANRTGMAADKIGQALTGRLGVHGHLSGQQFATMFMAEIGKVAPGVSSALVGLHSVGRELGAVVGAGGMQAAAGLVSLGATAVEVTKHLYEIGQTFDNVSKQVEIQTGKIGNDLHSITEAIDHVSTRTASSIQTIGGIAASVSQAFHVTGQPLERLTTQIANLDRMTGEHTNIRDLGKVMRSFGMDANQYSEALDQLKVASEHTGAPVGELLESLKTMGASARSLHLDFGQTAAVIDMFDKAGLDASTSTRGLNKAIAEATAHHVDLQTVLQRSIEDIKGFLDAGDEQKAQELAQKLFGARGAQTFIDAIRQGKLNVDDLNDALKQTLEAGHIDRLNESTMRWADTWQIVKNRIEDALKPLSGPVFDFVQSFLRDVSDPAAANRRMQNYNPGGPTSPGVPVTPGNILGPLGIPGQLPPAPGAPPPPPGAAGPLPPNAPPWMRAMLGGGGGQVNPGAPGLPPPPGGPAPGSLSDQLANDPNKVVAPHVPYPAGYGAPKPADETEEHYRLRMEALEKQHDLDEKQAQLDDLEKNHADKTQEIINARNEVMKAGMEQQSAQRAVTNYMGPKPEVPYGPGFGAPPRPGEPEKLYTAEQGMLEQQHKRAEAQALLNQLESSAGATNEQKIKARNDLATAERGEIEAQYKLREAALNTSKDLGELGAQIDNDFGISKGIPGIVENLVKTMADVAAAPMLGKMAAVSNINEAQTGIQGGYGLLGIMGAKNLSQGLSPLFGNPLGGAAAEAGYSSIGGGGWLGNLLGLGGPGLTKRQGIPGYIPGGAPNLGGSGAGGGGANLYQDAGGRYHSRDPWWEGNIQAESKGQLAPTGNPTHFGLFQFSQDTWDGIARQVAPEWVGKNPGTAPAEVQARMAQENYNQNKGNLGGQWANPFVAAHPGGTAGSIFSPGNDANTTTTAQGGQGGQFLQGVRGPGGPGTSPNKFPLNAPEQAFSINGVSTQLAAGGPGQRLAAFAQWFNNNIEPVKELAGYDAGGHGLGNQSNHTSGTALDINWSDFSALQGHGADATTHFGPDKMAAIKQALAQFGMTWGQDWTPDSRDPGHFELGGASYDQNAAQNIATLAAGGIAPGNYGGPLGSAGGAAGSALGAAAGVVPVFVTNMGGGGFGAGLPLPAAPGAPGPAAPPAPGDQNTTTTADDAEDDFMSPAATAPSSGPAAAGLGGAPGSAGPGNPNDPNDNRPGGGGKGGLSNAPTLGGPAAAPPPGAPGPAPGQGRIGGQGGPGAGPTKIGGVEPSSNPQGGQLGLTPGGSIDTAMSMAAMAFPGVGQAAQTGVKLANRAIQYGGQVAGILMSGALETWLPTGGSELANKSWFSKIVGGLAGARPQLPNLAGGAGAGAMQPKQDGGKGEGQQGPQVQQNLTVNQASAQPANDIEHHLGVMNQNMPAMGR